LNDKPEHTWQLRLYETRAAQLLLYGRALGLSHSEAEDVLQEVFLALLRLTVEPAEPAHYAVRAFRHRVLNYRRSLWRRLTREMESNRWFDREEGETLLERAAMHGLELLAADQREVIVLKIWHGYTFEQIGALLELSPNTAAARYRYGWQKLRSYVKEIDYERVEYNRGPAQFFETPHPISPS
jgi:RNA polymerase sigma-70 factor, ECF subfamily